MTLRKDVEPKGVSIIQADSPLIGGERGSHDMVPAAYDVNLGGECQLRCDFCWGVPHTMRGIDSVDPWAELFANAAANAAKFRREPPNVTFTGGEPLLSPLLLPALEAAKSEGLSTTISTNAIAYKALEKALPWADSVGIPVDGSTPDINAAMRAGSNHHSGLQRAVGGILMSQEAGKPTTVRIVVGHKNLRDVPNIPGMLESKGVDIGAVRFKLYQLTPIGPRAPGGAEQSLQPWDKPTSVDDVLRVAVRILCKYPGLKLGVQLYPLSYGRYFQVRPDGSAYTVGIDVDNEFTPSEVELGNAFEDFPGALSEYFKAMHDQVPVVVLDYLSEGTLNERSVPYAVDMMRYFLQHGPSDVNGPDQKVARWLRFPPAGTLFEPVICSDYTMVQYADAAQA